MRARGACCDHHVISNRGELAYADAAYGLPLHVIQRVDGQLGELFATQFGGFSQNSIP